MREISFDGVSGTVDFNNLGDRLNPIFSVNNYYQHGGAVREAGSINETKLVLSDELILPDGIWTPNNKYGPQLKPWCKAGSSPAFNNQRIWSCTLCPVGYYKPEAGQDECITCMEGHFDFMCFFWTNITIHI